MGILQGIVSFLLGMATNGLDYLTKVLYEPFGYELTTFEKYFPAAAPFRDMFIFFGLGILFLIYLFQLLRNFGVPIGIQAEDPIKLTFKLGLFWALIWYSKGIMDYILFLFTAPLEIFTTTDLPYNQQGVMDIVLNIIGAATGIGLIVNIICTLILAWQFIKLLLEVIERYIVLCFVVYTAPVAFSTGAFESTAQIFKSWCRLCASQILLILLNVWSIRLFTSFFRDGLNAYTGTDFLMAFFLGLAFLKFAQKIDTLLRIIGLNTASTGGNLGHSITSVIGTAIAMSRGAGKARDMFKHKDPAPGATHANAASSGAGAAGVRMSPGGPNSGAASTPAPGGAAASNAENLSQSQKDMAFAVHRGYNQAALNHEQYAPSAQAVSNSSNIANSEDAIIQGGNANAIGGSLIEPREGFEQTPLRMDDGSEGFLYKNPATGEAYAATYSEVGAGMVAGEMGTYNMQTGEIGNLTPFTMVSEDRAESIGGSQDGERIQGRDGNTYVPIQNLNPSASPFKSAPPPSSPMPGASTTTEAPDPSASNTQAAATPGRETETGFGAVSTVPNGTVGLNQEQAGAAGLNQEPTGTPTPAPSVATPAPSAGTVMSPAGRPADSSTQQRDTASAPGTISTPVSGVGMQSAGVQSTAPSPAASPTAEVPSSPTIAPMGSAASDRTVQMPQQSSSMDGGRGVTSTSQPVQSTADNTVSQQVANHPVGMSSQSTSVHGSASTQTNTHVSQSVSQNAGSAGRSVEMPQGGTARQQPSTEPNKDYRPSASPNELKPNQHEESFIGQTARVEPVIPPIPKNMQGKAESVKRPEVTEPDKTAMVGINAPEGDPKLSLGEKAHNLFERFRDIFK